MRFLSVLLILCVVVSAQAPRVKRPKDAPPELQMLIPGFEVKRLPVNVTNLVNLQYRHDGVLVALGYNGNIWLLRDTDGDGFEDRADLFWESKGKVTAPIGMDLATKGSPHGDAVFFACKGKVMMVTDRDGDGRAEEEKVIADGWPLARAGVDTASVCYDPRDGAVFFGLGVRWYNNAYELDERGVAHNDLTSERGAILRIAPDFKSREKLCTGVRWPIGLRFNSQGDLFCTDQEGATWLPNGNPFDELLLIERGRHYGFPPRHPKHLPNVIDEPSVFDYGPQHQSTCGMRFNDGVVFGPAWWKGDALVAGESRGKLFRTKLIKTNEGYVAANETIACLNQLAVDCTITPRGDLLLATHSGEPDWGTGPEGAGNIFVIRHSDKAAPQPVRAWSSSAETFRVRFDRDVDASSASITRGLYVRAGDELETMWPGYEVVKMQQAAPVTAVPVKSVRVLEDQRTVELTVPPQSAVEHFGLKLGATSLHAELTGVDVEWKGDDGRALHTQWPHLDALVNRVLGAEALPKKSGTLTLRTRLDLWSMLRPAIQPGASLDYEPAPEEVTLWLRSPNSEFTVKQGADAKSPVLKSQLGQVTHDVFITVTPARFQPLDLSIESKGEAPEFHLSWHTREDARERAMPLRRFLLPWAKPELTPGLAAPLPRPELQSGDWARGRAIFASDRALCSKCHSVRGVGGKIGPDLSNLTSRDFASVKRDIHDPGTALNPDYITHEVKLKDGRTFTAVLRDEGGDVVLGIAAGAEVRVKREEIASRTPLKISLMIPALDDVLGERDFRDLMAYLLTEPPLMGVYAKAEPMPRTRTRGEIDAVLAGAPTPPAAIRPLKVMLVAGKKDHGVGEHDYPRWLQVWSRLFTLADQTTLALADEWPTSDQWQHADAVVFFRRGDWSEARAQDFDAFTKRGGGATFIHWSLEAGDEAPALADRLGLASNRAQTKFRHGPLSLVFEAALPHPIARNFKTVDFTDEMYWNLVPSATTSVQPIATAAEAGVSHPQAWTQEPPGGGRIFVTLGGHYSWNFDDPLFRALVLRGIAWSAREPVDRFNNLIEAGVE